VRGDEAGVVTIVSATLLTFTQSLDDDDAHADSCFTHAIGRGVCVCVWGGGRLEQLDIVAAGQGATMCTNSSASSPPQALRQTGSRTAR
jgi:hypothetical protein